MPKKITIAIIGAGTAGLSAFKEASKYTDDIVIIDQGPLGTTCARVGCMPSKALIHTANVFFERKLFTNIGIQGAKQLKVDLPKVMSHVRNLRDRFTNGVVDYTQSLGEKLIQAPAKFLDANTLQVGEQKITANSIIIATGSRTIMPGAWQAYGNQIFTSETIFEQTDFAKTMAVIGGGIVGLELGQALARLDVELSLYHAGEYIGGITDPNVNAIAINILQNEFPLQTNQRVSLNKIHQGGFEVDCGSQTKRFAQVLAAMGRAPNLEILNLPALPIQLDADGIPHFNHTTMQIEKLPIFIAGDVNKMRPLLHEAADEGRIAGFNAAQAKSQCFKRRVPIRIVFTQPNIIGVGKSFRELTDGDIAIGEVDYSDQGRARIMNHNQGILRVYGDKKSGELLGAEGIAPDGEHLAHLLAWAIQKRMTVFEILQMPFYHPVIEEGMRTALRDLAGKVQATSKSFELAMCDSEAIHSLA